MLPFLLSHRLQGLSRSIIACTFREGQTGRELKQASCALYEDMLQYQTEHPGTTYQDIYQHFADDAVRHAVSKYLWRRRILGIAIVSILISIVFILALVPVCNMLLQNMSISFSAIQY